MSVDRSRLEAFAGKFAGDLAATMHAATVVVGDKLGLYRALAAGGPQTSAELAARTGYEPRLVREWCNAQAASGYCEYDPAGQRYFLTAEQAACLADEDGPHFLAGGMTVAASAHKGEDRVRGAFAGAVLGWHDQHEDLFAGTDRFFRARYHAALVSDWIPALEDVEAKLRAGARVADVGCGYGATTVLLAQAFPASTFSGFDYHPESVEAARKAAAEAGVSDRVTFEVALADDFPGAGYDLACLFNALHEMGDPVRVGRHIREALAADGTLLVVEPLAGDHVEDNLNAVGRLFYSTSTLVCVPNALSQGATDALGAQAGQEALHRVMTAAGFTRVRRAAQTPFNLVLEARP